MVQLTLKCPLCNCYTCKNDKIKLYASEKNDVFCCPICKLSSNDDDNLTFYCLKCGHKMCDQCITHINNQKNNNDNGLNINYNSPEYNRLYKISKLLVRTLRYSNHTFIATYNDIISAPMSDVYDNLNKYSVSPAININDIYNVINMFKYRSGRKRFGLSIINEIEYIDTDTRIHEY